MRAVLYMLTVAAIRYNPVIAGFLPETTGSGKASESDAGGMHTEVFGDLQRHGEGGSAMEPGLCQPLTSNTVACPG